MSADEIAKQVAATYCFSYATQVNLEAIANKLLEKFSPEDTLDILDDLCDNINSYEIKNQEIEKES